MLQPVQVLPRIRLAPGYALAADDGGVLTSEAGRGTITLYSFLPATCAGTPDGGAGATEPARYVIDEASVLGRNRRILLATLAQAGINLDLQVVDGQVCVLLPDA